MIMTLYDIYATIKMRLGSIVHCLFYIQNMPLTLWYALHEIGAALLCFFRVYGIVLMKMLLLRSIFFPQIFYMLASVHDNIYVGMLNGRSKISVLRMRVLILRLCLELEQMVSISKHRGTTRYRHRTFKVSYRLTEGWFICNVIPGYRG